MKFAYIVIHEADSDSDSCFNAVSGWIMANRKDGYISHKCANRIAVSDDMSKEELKATKARRMAYYNIANTLCNYLSLTQFIDRGYKTISIRSGKENDVDSFIQKSPKYFSHPELTENYLRAFGRGFAAKDLRDFNRVDVKSTKALIEARIRKEYVLLALKTPITGITPDVAETISNNTALMRGPLKDFLSKPIREEMLTISLCLIKN
jgi:hypothetical protein